ncbi:DUF6207 family protein [Streptomyces sp. NPDC005132]|uniref:DUF6207 family protein n=1 Tax=Streptomyces sp. NPDC005132 TaxID=3154294 RepID=UPI0033BDADFD
MPSRTENCPGQRVVPDMRVIVDAHVAEPGLAVVEIAGADDATAVVIQDLLTERCADGANPRIGPPGRSVVRCAQSLTRLRMARTARPRRMGR